MTQIICDIRDSQGAPLAGYILVTLDYDLAADGTSYLVVPSRVELVGGMATLNLEPSVIQNVSYKIDVYRYVTPQVTTLVKTFRTKVPDVATIPLTDLVPTGITNAAQDTAIAAVTRRLYLAPEFWAGVRNNVFKVLGPYNPATTYKQGNVVYWQGGTYVFVSDTASTGISPSDTSYWQPWAAQGQTGAGTTGNPVAYDATGWQGQTDAPSRGSIRNIIETLARKTELTGLLENAALVDPTRNALSDLADRSSKVPSTQWVQSLVDLVRRAVVPVGMPAHWFTATPPAGWVFYDGSLLSRTVYSQLFAVLGTTFGSGDGTTTFRLPDCRGRVLAGLDDMGSAGAANRLTGSWADIIGGAGGAEDVTLTIAQMPSHQHSIGGGQNLTLATGATAWAAGANGLALTQISPATNFTGGGQAHLNIQPTMTCSVIGYSGVF